MQLVDKLLVLRKLSDLESYQKQINEYSGLSLEEYDADWKTQRIVERTLQIMIEMCIDIAHHIISDMNFRLPATYADTFKVLEENGIIEKQLYASMEKMSKFRNIIVHQYEKINSEIVIAILRKHLNDFELFRNSIISFTKKAE
jgi:uncharacterized protein YutE (UPF0331/DUF86 family)